MKTPEPLSAERLYELCELSKTSPHGKNVKISWDELWSLVEMAKESIELNKELIEIGRAQDRHRYAHKDFKDSEP